MALDKLSGLSSMSPKRLMCFIKAPSLPFQRYELLFRTLKLSALVCGVVVLFCVSDGFSEDRLPSLQFDTGID
jgi:hypothetical protein